MASDRESTGAPIRLPATVTTSGMEAYVGRVFRYEGRVWTVTSGEGTLADGWPSPRFFLAENPDGSGERREVGWDELAVMLGV